VCLCIYGIEVSVVRGRDGVRLVGRCRPFGIVSDATQKTEGNNPGHVRSCKIPCCEWDEERSMACICSVLFLSPESAEDPPCWSGVSLGRESDTCMVPV
jgi:hypothetical protein